MTKHCKYYITLFDNNFTRNPFGGLAPERARLENSLIYVIVFPSVPRNDILRKCNKQFTSPPPLIRHYVTPSPRGQGFDGCTIVYTKGDYMVPFQGMFRLHNEKHVVTLNMK